MVAKGYNNRIIAEKVSLNPQMVCKRCQRYIEQGLTALHDELRPGRPCSISDEEVAKVIRRTLRTKPKDTPIGPFVVTDLYSPHPSP
jgi:putative transposase